MANNQKKLKAFVRYDGSGRVVASSLILRKNKPRVGRWFEIPTYECCNGDSSTTTSTTTVAPTTTSTTTSAPQLKISESSSTACSGGGTSVTGYTFTGGTTICNSTMITSSIFAGFNPGTQYISDGVNTVQVNVSGFGSPYVYPQGECVACQ